MVGIFSDDVNHLKCLLLTIIEELPRNLFTDLKTYLGHAKLIVTPEEFTPLMKIRRFIRKFVKVQDPSRNNEELELLEQKNLMFVDLGFPYVSDFSASSVCNLNIYIYIYIYMVVKFINKCINEFYLNSNNIWL